MTTVTAEATNFPILGEPLAVELVNTLYSHATGLIDFLETPGLIASWFAQAPAASGLAMPKRITNRQCDIIRDLRDAGRAIFCAVSANDNDVRTAIAKLNKYAARASCRSRLDWDEAAGLRSTLVYEGGRFDVFVAHLAAECINFVAGTSLEHVRRCAHPHCEMFFVQQHRTRRFCHESCAHRARQARYYHANVNARRAGPKQPGPDAA